MTVLNNTEYIVGTDTYSEGTTKGYVIAGVRNNVLATLVNTDNEIGPVQINEVGALYTNPSGLVSGNNSSSSTLSANAIFTGTADDVTNFASIIINVLADVPSDKSGLSLQFSSDSSNWDIKMEHDMIANEEKVFELIPEAKYFRVVYTNGTINQGIFRIQTLYHSAKGVSNSNLLGVDTYVNKSMRGNMIGGVRKNDMASLVDKDEELAPIQINSMGELKTDTTELRKIRNILEDILVQLKISNMHNQIMTDEYFTEDEVV